MARPLRILFEGAYYHVINRGQDKRDIFLDKNDYKAFLRTLKETCQLYEVSIASYCLMTNHYHLLVHTPNANLSDFMRQINGVYTQVFNRRYKHDGPLFKGRYKAIVVQEGGYLLRLIRYAHNNPVKAGVVKKNSDYAFSSHNNFIRQEENEWLKFLGLLKTQFKGQKDLKKAYINFMKKNDDELEEFLQDKSKKAMQAIIFGDEAYMDDIKMKYLHGQHMSGEIPQAKQINDELKIKNIKKEVIKAFKIEEKNLYSSIRGKKNNARIMAIGLARECSGLSYGKIAQIFGGINYKSAAKYYERIKRKCKSNDKIKKLFYDLKQRCSQVET
ncbi:MAG: transposase [Candidatus Omnitrophica bacterium]|nr:transposase [Candidatus Omnitrophota bacterium]